MMVMMVMMVMMMVVVMMILQAVFFQGLGDPEVYPRPDGDVYVTGFPDPPAEVIIHLILDSSLSSSSPPPPSSPCAGE